MVALVTMPPSSGLMLLPCSVTSPHKTKLATRRSVGAVRMRLDKGWDEYSWSAGDSVLYDSGEAVPSGGAAQILHRDLADGGHGRAGKKAPARNLAQLLNLDRHAGLLGRASGCAESSDRPRKIL